MLNDSLLDALLRPGKPSTSSSGWMSTTQQLTLRVHLQLHNSITEALTGTRWLRNKRQAGTKLGVMVPKSSGLLS